MVVCCECYFYAGNSLHISRWAAAEYVDAELLNSIETRETRTWPRRKTERQKKAI